MEWNQVTMDDLKANCQSLLEEYATEVTATLQQRIAELEAKPAAVVAESAPAETVDVVALEERVAAIQAERDLLIYERAVLEASATEINKIIAEELRTLAPTVEEIPAALPVARTKSIGRIVAPITPAAPVTTAAGVSRVTEEQVTGKQLTKEQEEIMHYAV